MDSKELICVIEENVKLVECDFVEGVVDDFPIPVHFLKCDFPTMLFQEEVGLE